jgi:hypothetical protein
VVTSTGAGRHLSARKRSRGSAIAADPDQNIDNLTVLIDRAVQVGPAPGDLDVSLIDEPAITTRVPGGAGRVDELSREVWTQR